MASVLKERFSHFFGVHNRLAAVLVWASFLVCLANLAMMASFLVPRWGHLRFLRLHYTAALGVDWVGDWRYLFVFPGLAVLVFGLNGWLAGFLAKRQRRLGLMVLAVTVIIEAFVASGGAIAISLNG